MARCTRLIRRVSPFVIGYSFRMLMDQDITNIVRQVATAQLPSTSFEDVITEPMVDSQGHDALRITIVLRPDVVSHLSGDDVLDTLVQIQRRLSQEGEERFSLIEYATREELDEVGDS
jgi:hypothetical protein